MNLYVRQASSIDTNSNTKVWLNLLEEIFIPTYQIATKMGNDTPKETLLVNEVFFLKRNNLHIVSRRSFLSSWAHVLLDLRSCIRFIILSIFESCTINCTLFEIYDEH